MTLLVSLVASAALALPLRAATYNVGALSARDSHARFTDIAATIERSGFPELLALEEVADDDGLIDSGHTGAKASLGKLAEALIQAGGPVYQVLQFDPVNGSDGGPPGANIRCVLMVNGASATRAAPLFANDPAFSDTRKPLHAQLTMADGTIDVVVVHLSAAPYGKSKRALQAQRLAAWARQHAKNDLVVLGDFNATADEPVWPALRAAGLFDTTMTPLPTHESGHAFDRIFITERLMALQPAQVMPRTAGSDHALVWVPLQRQVAEPQGGCSYAPTSHKPMWWWLLLMVCKRWRPAAIRRCGQGLTCGSIRR